MASLQPLSLWFPLIAFCIACAGTAWLAKDLKRRGQADRPNARSSHVNPTPRGGGLAILAAFIPFSAMLGMPPVLVLMLALLVLVSWVDDKSGLAWPLRLLTQCFALGLSMAALWAGGILPALHENVPFIPLVLFVSLIGFWWLWHVNLMNFMDGIDGLAAVQTMVICFGAGAYFLDVTENMQAAFLALTLGAATLGFFVWNYPPARIFLGDVGSIPLGFSTGALLLLLAASGAWGLALALPLWFWCDATVTLVRRVSHGHSVVEPHREHFYQRAAGATPTGHKRVLHVFMLLQVMNMLFLAVSIKALPDLQWLLPIISASFGVLYFQALKNLTKRKA